VLDEVSAVASSEGSARSEAFDCDEFVAGREFDEPLLPEHPATMEDASNIPAIETMRGLNRACT
jgi:hypothetical protein